MHGSLALVGSGEYLPSMEPVDRELISWLSEPARVVCLPTAAGTEGAERIGYWSRLGAEHFRRLGAEVDSIPVIDRASACAPDHAERITQANMVYLSGGKPDYLYRTLEGTPVWQAISDLLARGGLLAGCSAGAMVQGGKFFGFPGWRTGFGLWPSAAIIPHFDELPEAMIMPMRMLAGKLTIFGVEANTALARKGDAYWVLGAGGVTIFSDGQKQRYLHGPLPPTALPT
jgi:cyanophycinase